MCLWSDFGDASLKHNWCFNFQQNLFTTNFSKNIKIAQKVPNREVVSITLSKAQITWNFSEMSDLEGVP